MQIPLFKPESNWEPPSELPDLRRVGLVGLDSETRDDGLAANIGPGWPFKLGYVDGISYYFDDQRYGYVPLTGEGAFPKENVARWLKDHFKSSEFVPVFHNAPYDLGWMQTDLDVPLPTKFHDTLCAAVHVDENRLTYSLDDLCRWQGVSGKDEQLLMEAGQAFSLAGFTKHGKPKKVSTQIVKQNMWKLDNRYKGPYAEQDARSTLKLWEKLYKELREQGTYDAYRTDVELTPLSLKMRGTGIKVDLDEADRAAEKLDERADEILRTLSDKLNIGRRITMHDVRSPDTLEILFNQEKVKIPNRTAKTNKGSFTTDWMEGHAHWLPAGVAAARKADETANKFIRNYIMDFSHNGRIHGEMHVFRSDEGGTRSHRVSYSNPPLQQMPGDRNPELKKMVRNIFLPDYGYWLAADYSQQEPRLTVHYAALSNCYGYEKALEYYEDPNADYHNMVVHLTGLQRPEAKIINLGLAYGMGLEKLAASLGVTADEARVILTQYHDNVPFVGRLTEKCSKRAAQVGYITLIDGARCRFDTWEPRHRRNGEPFEIAQSLHDARIKWPGRSYKRSFTHKAMNRLIQGSAARQTKKAMLECWRQGILPVLQMHDELDFFVTEEREVNTVVEIMKTVVPLKVPVKVDAELGLRWGTANQTWQELKSAA